MPRIIRPVSRIAVVALELYPISLATPRTRFFVDSEYCCAGCGLTGLNGSVGAGNWGVWVSGMGSLLSGAFLASAAEAERARTGALAAVLGPRGRRWARTRVRAVRRADMVAEKKGG